MSVWPPDDIDVLDLDDLDRPTANRSGPQRRPPRSTPSSSGSWTDPRFLVPLLLFLAAVFVIGMAVRSGSINEEQPSTTDPAASDIVVEQSALALAVSNAQLRAGFDALTISEDDGTIIIEGQARDALAAASIGAVARSVEGTQRVDNRVVVVGGAVESAIAPSVAPAANPPATVQQELSNVGRITFETGSASLTPDGSIVVDSAAAILTRVPGVMVEIHGHTDSDGEDIRNEILSQERADAVVTALGQRGVETSRLTSVGFGESKPIEPNITDDGRAANRRIEFLVVN